MLEPSNPRLEHPTAKPFSFYPAIVGIQHNEWEFAKTSWSEALVVNQAMIGLFWFLFKVSAIIYLLIWFRGTFPRFRYDQLMNIGWKIAIPVGMAAVLINAVLGMTQHG